MALYATSERTVSGTGSFEFVHGIADPRGALVPHITLVEWLADPGQDAQWWLEHRTALSVIIGYARVAPNTPLLLHTLRLHSIQTAVEPAVF